MAVPMVIVLGFVCTFYIYVAIRWWHVAMLARQEGLRASAMVRLSADAQGENIRGSALRDGQNSGANMGFMKTEYGNRSVIVMSQARAGKQQKRVVA
jgi:hypothetical protein